MISKNRLKLIRSLEHKKYREKYNLFVCEGPKIVLEVLSGQMDIVKEIYCMQEFLDLHTDILNQVPGQVVIVEESELKQASFQEHPQQVLALLEKPEIKDEKIVFKTAFYLDAIRNPGNLGAILRIADWFGHETIFVSPDCVDHFNPKVVQSSMGSFLRLHVREKAIDELRVVDDLTFYASSMDGESIYESVLSYPALIQIGTEGKGLSQAKLALADRVISIPGASHSQTESLNAAVAAGILASEFYRKSEMQ